MSDVRFPKLVEAANDLLDRGAHFYQKWTCGACGERVISDEMDILHTSMIHTDCPVYPGYETQISGPSGVGGGLYAVFGQVRSSGEV